MAFWRKLFRLEVDEPDNDETVEPEGDAVPASPSYDTTLPVYAVEKPPEEPISLSMEEDYIIPIPQGAKIEATEETQPAIPKPEETASPLPPSQTPGEEPTIQQPDDPTASQPEDPMAQRLDDLKALFDSIKLWVKENELENGLLVTSMKEELERMSRMRKELESKLALQQRSSDTLREELNVRRDENSALRQEIRELRTLAKPVDQPQAPPAEITALNERIAVTVEEKERLERRLSVLERENGSLRLTIENQLQTIQSLKRAEEEKADDNKRKKKRGRKKKLQPKPDDEPQLMADPSQFIIPDNPKARKDETSESSEAVLFVEDPNQLTLF